MLMTPPSQKQLVKIAKVICSPSSIKSTVGGQKTI